MRCHVLRHRVLLPSHPPNPPGGVPIFPFEERPPGRLRPPQGPVLVSSRPSAPGRRPCPWRPSRGAEERGTAEQWIKEGKYALNWTRLSCHRFVANRVRLSLFVLAYNLGNFLRRLCLPKAVKHWSLRSVQVKLIKMGSRLVRHSRRLIFQLSEVSVPRRLFQGCWIVSAGYRRRQAEGGYNHDLAKRESAPGSRLVFNALSPHWQGPEDDKDGQETWFTARIASLIG